MNSRPHLLATPLQGVFQLQAPTILLPKKKPPPPHTHTLHKMCGHQTSLQPLNKKHLMALLEIEGLLSCPACMSHYYATELQTKSATTSSHHYRLTLWLPHEGTSPMVVSNFIACTFLHPKLLMYQFNTKLNFPREHVR